MDFDKPISIDTVVERKIVDLEKLAPLHNKSSVELLEPVRKKMREVPIYGVFDTAFHRTIPKCASAYAIPQALAMKHHIQRYGFHGISHRYLLERYAYLASKRLHECNLVSMHLESGCSVTAIQQGKSVDNTMGLTPLEGLMMGTRSGDVDAAIVPLLMREEKMSVDEVMTLLNKKSGLAGVSEVSLDSGIDEAIRSESTGEAGDGYVRLPRKKGRRRLFGYTWEADAVIFGGGIAENTGFVRRFVCDGLRGFGVEIDHEANERLIDMEGHLSTGSKVEAWVIPTEEGLEIAYECCQAITNSIAPAPH